MRGASRAGPAGNSDRDGASGVGRCASRDGYSAVQVKTGHHQNYTGVQANMSKQFR